MMVDDNDMEDVRLSRKILEIFLFFRFIPKDAYALGMDDFRGMGVALHWL